MIKYIERGKNTHRVNTASLRGVDSWGSGSFKAPRGHYPNGKPKFHNGVDFSVPIGAFVLATKTGVVTKIGLPYNHDTYRYVEVTDDAGYKLRYFYIAPRVQVGDKIEVDAILGQSQDLDKRYKGITNHVHFEIMRPISGFINPSDYMRS